MMAHVNKILLLVEGEKIDPDLIYHLYNLYGIKNTKLYSYKTNIYALYHKLKKSYPDKDGNVDFEFIDLPLFLNDYLDLTGEERIIENEFQDILLIFDYDPQDNSYTKDKLIEMMNGFSNSTEIGKLYINFPMVESYKDIADFENGSFIESYVTIDEVQKVKGKNNYKRLVDSRTCIPDLEDIDKSLMGKIIELHSEKLNKILENDSTVEEKYMIFCQKQCELFEAKGHIWVLNTSLVHFLDEYGNLE